MILIINSVIDYGTPVNATKPQPSQEQITRFGITIPYPSGDYVELVKNINAKAVLDWRSDENTDWSSDDIDYLHVLRVSDSAYGNGEMLDTIPELIENNKGKVWIIGNEPDRYYYQDSVSPEVYAERYYNIAIRIRYLDSTAKLGFGSVVQPTPIRIRYLERALNRLTYLSCGNRKAALDLIDIWSIHAFILNEHLSQWGAGVPVGFENDWSDAISITDYSDTHSIEIFSQRIISFRNWMNSIGERKKPLWITEYGSLFPPIDPINGPDYVNIDDATTSDFMINSFDFMLNSINESTGFQDDENRLVQRWFWYSLNDYRYKFGGSLFDPDNEFVPTLVGEAYKNYTDQLILNPITGIDPVLFRQSGLEFPVFYDESLEIFNYPYEICFLCQLPLVLK